MPIVVSESLVRTLFPGRESLGQRLRLANGAAAEIVGIVGDTISERAGEPDPPMLYQPATAAIATTSTSTTILLSITGDARASTQALRAALSTELRSIDARLVAAPETIAAILARDADRYSAVIQLTGVSAGLGVFLSFVGIYGVAAFAAAQRRHEVGVRTALGARPREIVVLFVRTLRGPLIAGLAIGLALAVVGARLLLSASVIRAVDPVDPSAYGRAILTIVCTAIVATLIPALRAAYSDPWRVLRHE